MKTPTKILFVLALTLAALSACVKEAPVTPDPPGVKSQSAPLPTAYLPQNTAESVELSAAMAQLQSMQQYVSTGVPMPVKGGIDSTGEQVKARLYLSPVSWTTAYQYLTFDISIDDSSALTPLNAMSVTLEFTGDFYPAPATAFLHLGNEAIDWSSGVLLEHSYGQWAHVAWYSITPYNITSSTGGWSSPPTVCTLAVFGTTGTITFKVIELSPDGWVNYRVSKQEVNTRK